MWDLRQYLEHSWYFPIHNNQYSPAQHFCIFGQKFHLHYYETYTFDFPYRLSVIVSSKKCCHALRPKMQPI